MKARTLTLFVVAALLATTLTTRSQPRRERIPKLSAKERAAKIAALPADDRKWLEEYVAPIILEDERDLFIQLTEPHQREIFREEFWQRREQAGLADPLGPGYRNRYAHFREAAATEFEGLTSDPGRVVIIHGIPLIQEFRDCNEVFRSVEVWTYLNQVRRHAGRRGSSSSSSIGPPSAPRASSGIPRFRTARSSRPSSCLASATQACRPAGAHRRRRRRRRRLLSEQRRPADLRRGVRRRRDDRAHQGARRRGHRARDVDAAAGLDRGPRQARGEVRDASRATGRRR